MTRVPFFEPVPLLDCALVTCGEAESATAPAVTWRKSRRSSFMIFSPPVMLQNRDDCAAGSSGPEWVYPVRATIARLSVGYRARRGRPDAPGQTPTRLLLPVLALCQSTAGPHGRGSPQVRRFS